MPSMPEKTQQNFFNFVKSPRGKLTLGPHYGIPAQSLDRQNKCFLQYRSQTSFPWHHQKLDRSSTPKPFRFRSNRQCGVGLGRSQCGAVLWRMH